MAIRYVDPSTVPVGHNVVSRSGLYAGVTEPGGINLKGMGFYPFGQLSQEYRDLGPVVPVPATPSKKLYIAVVMRPGQAVSLRPDGSYTSFINVSKAAAVKLAMTAKAKFENRGSGPYVVYVGPLTQTVKPIESYTLVNA